MSNENSITRALHMGAIARTAWENDIDPRRSEDLPHGDDELSPDLWTSIFDPWTREREDADPVVAELIREMRETPAYRELGFDVMYDAELSWICHLAFLDTARERYETLKQEQENFERQLQEELAQAQAQGQPPPQAPTPQYSSDPQFKLSIAQTAKAQNEAVERARIIGKLAGTSPAQVMQNADTSWRLYNLEYIREVFELFGRMHEINREVEQLARMQNGAEPMGLKLGNENIVPEQLSIMDDEALSGVLMAKYADRALLCYDVKGSHSKKRSRVADGPIIVLVDYSGSMRGAPIKVAVALAFVLVANRIRRKIYAEVIGFNVDIVFRWCGNTVEEVIQALCRTPGGGTDFGPAIDAAIETVQSEQAEADIVIISDGYASFSDENARRLYSAQEQHNVRLFFLGVNDNPENTLKVLKDVSISGMWRIDPDDPHNLKKVIYSIQTK